MLSATVAGGGGRAVSAMLVVVLTVLVTVLTPVGCYRAHNVNSKVSRFEPLNSPASVECDLRGDSIIISATTLQTSVRWLRIVNAKNVTVRESALSRLNFLETIHFENITKLVIEGNVPPTQQLQGQVNVTLNRIKHVEMKTSSFSHWKKTILSISIANIGTCIIHGGAIVSNSSRSNAVLENITDGQFYTGTFTTTLGGLTLNNVTMTKPCKTKTFAGHIGKLSLKTVTIRDVQDGCFQAEPRWGSLMVRSSHLSDISERGLQGKIGDVLIEESVLGLIHPNGFDLDVSSLLINASSIEHLETNALNVRATGGISILKSNVTTISENAFQSLNSRKYIKLDQLAVTNVVNGSLSFSDVESRELRKLQLCIPCECSIWKQVNELFFSQSVPRFLTKRAKLTLLKSAFRNIRCLHNQMTPSLWAYYCQRCPHGQPTSCGIATTETPTTTGNYRNHSNHSNADRNNGTDRTSSTSAAPSWIPLVALFGCFLLLGAVITLLVIRHRRRSAPRRCTPRPKRPPSQRLSVADIQHSLPDLPRDGQQMDSASQSPGGKRPGEVPQTVAVGSTECSSLYENDPEATVGSAVCENVSGVASGYDQVLYAEIFPQEQTRGEEEAGFRADSTQAPPLYAEVNKGKGKSATTSDDFRYAADSSNPPVYAQVNKNKAGAIQRTGENTHQAANTGTSGTEAAGNVSEINATDDQKADMPVYAQVHKNKPDGKKRSVNKHPELDQTPRPPIYAQVKKNKPTASIQTSRHDPSQQTWQPADTPLYEEVSRLAPEESPLYASVMYTAADSADSKENDDFSNGYNALHGGNMSPTD